MKRHQTEMDDNDSSSNMENITSDEKRVKLNPSASFDLQLDNDCLGHMLNFLPIKQLKDLRFVCKNWNQIIDSEKIASLTAIKPMLNYCLESWKDERNDELFISLLKWLNAKERSTKLAKEHPEYFVHSLNPLVVDKYPSLTLISSTYGWFEDVVYSEVMCHLEQNVKIRMHFHISNAEDELVYINVEEGVDNTSFDWKPFNIDPKTRNILVHQVNGNAEDEYDITEYSQNTEFFNQIGNLFEEDDSFYQVLYKYLSDCERGSYEGVVPLAKDRQYGQAIEYKYSDDLREELIEKPLSNIRGELPEIIEILKHVVSNVYSSCLNRLEYDEDLIVNFIDVKGKCFINQFRANLHGIDCKFKLIHEESQFSGRMQIHEHFYYGHDGYEGGHIVELTSQDQDGTELYPINGRSYGTDEMVVWDERDIKQEIDRMGLNKPFKTVDSFIEDLIESVVRKLPLIDAYYCVPVSDSGSLISFLQGRID